jgi:hypothetical protein
LKKRVEAELDRLVREGTICPVTHSDWAAPIVPVVKADGTIRICGDYKTTVNKVSKLDRYPIPKTEDLLTSLCGGKTFSKLDLSQAYQQLLLEDEARKFLTINTHKGLFEYCRLPFGVKSAPGIFQRALENLLRDVPFVIVRMDDILLSGLSDEDHLRNLREVLRRLSEAGLRLKRSKCLFFAPEVVYCGRVVNAEGTRPSPSNVHAITEARAPKNSTELRAFLGMLNFYNADLPHLATTLEPMHKLLRKHVQWQWNAETQTSFQEAKNLLTNSSLLTHYDEQKELIVACDSSPYGVGAVLSHIMEDGSEKPIAFASRTLNSAERNYSQLDKEGLALLFGVKKFHQFVYGRKFILTTDHKPLLGLFGDDKAVPQMASPRLIRWILTLSGYDYKLKFQAGCNNGNADALSRLPLDETVSDSDVPGEVIQSLDIVNQTVNAATIKAQTFRDPVYSQVLNYCRRGWPDRCPSEDLRPFFQVRAELSLQDGCLLRGCRVIVPTKSQEVILEELHEMHPGVCRMKALARNYVWWPGLDKGIERLVRQCSSCQIHRHAPEKAPLHPWEYPSRPWERLHLDYAGPFYGKMFLIIVDAYS